MIKTTSTLMLQINVRIILLAQIFIGNILHTSGLYNTNTGFDSKLLNNNPG